ncbi:MAG: HU family DNA-binding protein [Clostridiales bacterium]|nr:HU family DNA-binding protein [Clostridiales bacterium]
MRHAPARKARNPKTGETLQVPATPYPTFRAGKTLKEIAAAFQDEKNNVKMQFAGNR